MKLQQQIELQVCSFEHAKELKALGITQNAIFVWCDQEKPRNVICLTLTFMTKKYANFSSVYYSAFTVAELSMMLSSATTIWYEAEYKRWCCRPEGFTSPFVDQSQAGAIVECLLSQCRNSAYGVKNINDNYSDRLILNKP